MASDILAPRGRIGINPRIVPVNWPLPVLTVLHDDATNPANLALGQFTPDANGPSTHNVKGRGTAVIPLDVVAEDRVFDFKGDAYSGGLIFNNSNLRAYVDGAFVSGQAPPMRLVFETGPANTVPLQRLAIFSNGFTVIGSDKVTQGVTEARGLLSLGGNATVEAYLERASADAVGSRLVFIKTRGTLAAPANAADDDVISDIVGQARATTLFDTAMIRFLVSDTVVAAQRPASRMEFYTNTNNNAQALRVMIDRNGDMGVGAFADGTVDVEERIHSRTAGANALQWALQLQNPDNTNNNLSATGILFDVDSNGGIAKGAIAYYRDTTDWARGRFRIFQNNEATSAKPTILDTVVQIENNGNFGIARRGLWSDTELPAAHLHILGEGAADLHFHIEKCVSDTSPPLIEMYKSRGTVAARTNVAQFDETGRISWFAYSNSYFEGAQIVAYIDAAVVAGQAPSGALVFKTTPVNSVPTDRLRIYSGGLVHIGDSGTPGLTRKLYVVHGTSGTAPAQIENTATGAAAHVCVFRGGDNAVTGSDFSSFIRPDGTKIGDIDQNSATTVAFNTSSDARLKENIVDFSGGLATVLSMKARKFNFKADPSKRELTGFIAQELHAVFPDAVSPGSGNECDCHIHGEKVMLAGAETWDGNHCGDCCHTSPWGVDYAKVTPVLVKAIQELYALIKPN